MLKKTEQAIKSYISKTKNNKIKGMFREKGIGDICLTNGYSGILFYQKSQKDILEKFELIENDTTSFYETFQQFDNDLAYNFGTYSSKRKMIFSMKDLEEKMKMCRKNIDEVEDVVCYVSKYSGNKVFLMKQFNSYFNFGLFLKTVRCLNANKIECWFPQKIHNKNYSISPIFICPLDDKGIGKSLVLPVTPATDVVELFNKK